MRKFDSHRVSNYDLELEDHLRPGQFLELISLRAPFYARSITDNVHLYGQRFDRPSLTRQLHAGDILDFYGETPEYGEENVTFRITAKVGDEVVGGVSCTYAAVDEEGNPVPIKPANKAEQP